MDKDTHEPISGVKITIADQVVYADLNGLYQIPNVPCGKQNIIAEKENYILRELEVFIWGSEQPINIGLTSFLLVCPGIPTVTYYGKTYHTVQIGDQCWLKENLNIGTRIEGSLRASNNNVIEKYCYDDDENNCNTYGGLYRWDEAMQYSTTQGAQGICPDGWHIPTLAELQTLSDAVGGFANSLKAIGQGTGDYAGTNTIGFCALLAGRRLLNGSFMSLGGYTSFWSSTVYNTYYANYMYLATKHSNLFLLDSEPSYSYSVRCIKD